MNRIPKDQVVDASDIVAVVGERVALQRKGKEFVGLCPFHNDTRPSMSVSPTKQIFKCWSCGAGGDVIKFVQLSERTDFRGALEILARRAGIELRQTGPADGGGPQVDRASLQRVLEWAAQHFTRNLQSERGAAALEYARKRGLSDESIERFGLGVALDDWGMLVEASQRSRVPENLLFQAGLAGKSENGRVYDRFRDRLIFPIRDQLGRPVAFGGRALGDDPAKYLNSPETPLFSKSRILYGLHLSRNAIANEKTAIVVEGYLDAVLLMQHGIENVVATLGTALTDRHVSTLKPYADRLFLCFDGDEAGMNAAARAVEISVQTGIQVFVVMMEEGTDPADCVVNGGSDSFKKYLQSAKDALHFKWALTLGRYENSTPAAKQHAIAEYLQFLTGACGFGGIDPVQQGLFVSRLSEILGIPSNEVYRMLSTVRRKPTRTAALSADADNDAPGYADTIRHMPAALTTAVEEALGLLVESCGLLTRVTDDFVGAVGKVPAWQSLYDVLLNEHEDAGTYDRARIVEQCDDPVQLETLHACLRRYGPVAGVTDEELFDRVLERIREVTAARAVSEASSAVREGQSTDAAAFAKLLDAARQQESVVPREYRLRPTRD